VLAFVNIAFNRFGGKFPYINEALLRAGKFMRM
jgi:hypothetical protein